MLTTEHILHLAVAKTGSNINHPVGEINQHLTCQIAVGIQVSVPQSGIRFVYIIEGYPFAI